MPSLPYALIVDDEAIVAQVVARMLSVAGYRTLVACDGPSALGALERAGNRVAVAVLDLRLPGLNGIALAEAMAIRFPETGILFIAGNPDDMGDRPHRPMLAKPFRSTDLVHAVDRERRAHRRRYMKTEAYAARLCGLIDGASRHARLAQGHVSEVQALLSASKGSAANRGGTPLS